jgi:hypothetical protein
LIIYGLFVMVLLATGSALAQSRDFDNPFTALSRIQLGGQFGGGDRNVNTDANTTQRQPPPSRNGGGRGGDQDTWNWSAFRSVLFNVWFLLAAVAVVIPLQFVVDKLFHWGRAFRNRINDSMHGDQQVQQHPTLE